MCIVFTQCTISCIGQLRLKTVYFHSTTTSRRSDQTSINKIIHAVPNSYQASMYKPYSKNIFYFSKTYNPSHNLTQLKYFPWFEFNYKNPLLWKVHIKMKWWWIRMKGIIFEGIVLGTSTTVELIPYTCMYLKCKILQLEMWSQITKSTPISPK